ncbi:amino acid permease [Williamsia herbipolensis]|uniref:amino acid permease n=1 Tax=Williamsia herbipolensis TaxID=1603258 RepID=UPI0009E3E3B4|nr:amino acid permease [Williamsia herbipolensis]
MATTFRPQVRSLRRRTPTVPTSEPDGERVLHRRLGRLDLIAMGVGAIVGAGIFVTTGVAAATKAGPAIMISFVLAGVICVLVALCYSELASMTPMSGSAYTYTYQSMGEQSAFLVGWNLLLELVVAGSAVAIGWSGLFTATLHSLFDVTLPTAITAGPGAGGVVNLPAVLIIGAIVAVLVLDVKLTAAVVKSLVALTIAVLVLVVIIGAPHVHTSNWAPFAPFGAHGIAAGAALAFFAYLGFDIVATSAEETKNPGRDMPWGIIGSVVIATVLYVGVSAVLTGVAPYPSLNNEAPVATALAAVGAGWIGKVILVASVIALTKGLLMLFYGQTRLVFAMCRDGMLPRALSVTTRRGAPKRLGIALGIVGAVIAGLLPIDTVAELVNIGALFAFAVVAIGVMILRYTAPERARSFRVPLMPLVPVLAIAGCVWLLTTLEALTWIRFAVWTAVGIAVYVGYSHRHSVAGRTDDATEVTTDTPGVPA